MPADTMPTREPAALVSVKSLHVNYPIGAGQTLPAVQDVSFQIRAGETLALVGESGCGKSSTARAVMQLAGQVSGEILLDGVPLTQLSARKLRQMRHRFQIIFQDPIASLNPRRTIREALLAPLKISGLYRGEASLEKVRDMLRQVGLDPESVLDRYPHEFSGGQCQRLSIARALLLDPVFLVCDEPVSALDVSVRAQVLNVLNDLQRQRQLTMLFISHDLAVVKNVADRVAVMYLGRICEIGDAKTVLSAPLHPYTAALLRAVPDIDSPMDLSGSLRSGETPSPMDPPSGCAFRQRCPRAQELCAQTRPELGPGTMANQVACHFPLTQDATQ